MRLTIIPSDDVVCVGGVCKAPLDLSTCEIPANVHALQWFETRGWIEFNDDGDPFTPRPANEDIDTLPAWADSCAVIWEQEQPPEEQPAA